MSAMKKIFLTLSQITTLLLDVIYVDIIF